MRRVVKDVPQSDVQSVVNMIEADGGKATPQQQPNGLWTVTGDYPDKKPAPAAGAPVASAPVVSPPAAAGGAGDAQADVLARTIWGEARGEAKDGKEAVAAVVMNRVRSGRFRPTPAGVCRQPKQFSCWNDDDPNHDLLERLAPGSKGFDDCMAIASRAVSGTLPDPTSGATHYHTLDTMPSWAVGKTPCCTIGRHRFYNDVA